MKTTTSVLRLSLAGLLFAALFSCTRSVTQPTPSPSSLIIGKWTMKAAIGNYTDQGVNNKDTTLFTTDDYFDFKADSTIFINATGSQYNGNWKIVGGKLFITGTNYLDAYVKGFDLPILTSTNLQMYYTDTITTTTPISTLEQKLNLAR